jgi:hypothetical protein
MGKASESGILPNSFEPAPTGQRLTEEQRMRDILREYEPRLGSFDLVKVGDVGWILQSRRRKPKAYPRIVVASDVDDTLLRSTEIKDLRKSHYRDFLRDKRISVPDAQVDELVKTTYTFVQEKIGAGNYYTDNHAVVLDWVTSQLRDSQPPAAIQDTLTRIGQDGIHDSDPFVIEEGMVFAKEPSHSLPELQQMFRETLTKTPPFQDTVDALMKLCGRRDQGESLSIDLLTLGYPPEQLLKVFGLMERNRAFTPDHILITKDRKDTFLAKVVETESMKPLPRAYTDGQDTEDGYVFGTYDHVIVGVDDSIKSLNSQAAVNEFLAEETGAQITLVRLRRDEAKDGPVDWEIKGDHLEVDLRGDRVIPASEQAMIFLNRGDLHMARKPERVGGAGNPSAILRTS